jgi:hypothetical protein
MFGDERIVWDGRTLCDHRDAVTVANWTSAGIPILSIPPEFGTRTLIA